MDRIEIYLNEYAKSHRHPTNLIIHKICVPLIVWSLLGFLHTFVLIEPFRISHVMIIFALIFYMWLKSARIVIAILLMSILIVLSFRFMSNLRMVSIIIFVLAWIGQFYGHKIEKQKPSFFKDLFFLLIGPVWVLAEFFPWLKIKNN